MAHTSQGTRDTSISTITIADNEGFNIAQLAKVSSCLVGVAHESMVRTCNSTLSMHKCFSELDCQCHIRAIVCRL